MLTERLLVMRRVRKDSCRILAGLFNHPIGAVQHIDQICHRGGVSHVGNDRLFVLSDGP